MTFHCLYEGKFTRGLESDQTTLSLPSNTTSVSSKMNTLPVVQPFSLENWCRIQARIFF